MTERDVQGTGDPLVALAQQSFWRATLLAFLALVGIDATRRVIQAAFGWHAAPLDWFDLLSRAVIAVGLVAFARRRVRRPTSGLPTRVVP